MPYRSIENSARPCIICMATPSVQCRNCSVFHCDQHLLAGSCPGCTLELAPIEERLMRRVALLLVVPVVLAAVAVAYLSSSVLLGVGSSMLLWGGFARSTIRSIVGRSLATRQLRPTSKPLVLAANAEHQEGRENDYFNRRRQRAARRRAPRAVSVGGGYCYWD
jgi:hypothetical protein